jgi:hypothetical protein
VLGKNLHGRDDPLHRRVILELLHLIHLAIRQHSSASVSSQHTSAYLIDVVVHHNANHLYDGDDAGAEASRAHVIQHVPLVRLGDRKRNLQTAAYGSIRQHAIEHTAAYVSMR